MEDIKIKKYNYNNSKGRNTILKLIKKSEPKLYYKCKLNYYKEIELDSILGVIYGPRTITFSNVKECIPHLCLSLILRHRTYDLEFNNLEEIIELYDKLKKYNSNIKITDNNDILILKYNWINENLSATNFYDKYKLWLSTYLLIDNLKLKESININKNNLDCSICIDKIAENKLFITKCKHYFHIECISLWMKEDSRCPICRHK